MRAVQDSSLKVYITAWRAMNDFYCRLDNKPKPYEQRLALFVAYMIKKRYEKQTIKTYISGIKYVLRNILHIQIDDAAFSFTALIKGARYKNSKPHLRLPIKLRLLNRILDEVEKVPRLGGQPYLVKLYRAMFASAYYGLLRVGEMTGKHAVKSRDVHMGRNKRKVQLRLWTSKTLQWGCWPDDIKIEGLSDCGGCFNAIKRKGMSSQNYCPVHIIREFNAIRETTKGDTPFFVYKSGITVSAHAFRAVLKTILCRIGLQKIVKSYNCQSFRAGRCSDLRRLGFSISDLKFFGRWKSNSVYRYLKCV